MYIYVYVYIHVHGLQGAPWSTQDNSSMSCKELVIRVTMPDTKFSTV